MNAGSWVAAVLVSAACVVFGARIQSAEIAEAATTTTVANGLEALKQSRFDDARIALGAERAEAVASGDTEREARARFYLGLVDQQQAAAGGVPESKKALLESAALHYRFALEQGPESAGILNNLARVEADLGKTNEALATMSRAVDANDVRRGFYAENYADMLLEAGRWRDACRVYGVVAREQPMNRTVHRKLVDSCVRLGPDLLAWYLWDLATAGQVSQVLDSALAVMRDPVWSVPQREELMGLVAYCLARRKETVEAFRDSKAAGMLRDLVDDPVVGDGARGILHLYQGGPLDENRVAWWAGRNGQGAEPRRGQWPMDAFQDLVRSLGDRAGAEGNPGRQEAYWILAVGMKPGSPDPEALWLLANVYSERRDTNRLDALMKRYEVDIFRGKGEAYSSARTHQIYRYHMALGVIYSDLNRWTSPDQIDSAMFQLKRALDTADHLNAQAEQSGWATAPVQVPTRLVDLLATGYEKSGQKEQSARLRLDRAEKYLRLDQRDAARQVMTPLPVPPAAPNKERVFPAGWNQSDKTRWKDIDEQLRKPKPTPGSGTPGIRPVQVRVAPEANVVAGSGNRWRLTAQELRSVESSVSNVVRQMQSRPGDGAARSRGGLRVAPEIQEVNVSGDRGRVLLRQGTNLVQVPIRLEGAAGSVTNRVRYVRP